MGADFQAVEAESDEWWRKRGWTLEDLSPKRGAPAELANRFVGFGFPLGWVCGSPERSMQEM